MKKRLNHQHFMNTQFKLDYEYLKYRNFQFLEDSNFQPSSYVECVVELRYALISTKNYFEDFQNFVRIP